MKLDNYDRSIALAGRQQCCFRGHWPKSDDEQRNMKRVDSSPKESEWIDSSAISNKCCQDPDSWDGVYAFYICCVFCVQSRWYRHGRSWVSNLGILRRSLPQTLCQSNYLHDPNLPFLFTLASPVHNRWNSARQLEDGGYSGVLYSYLGEKFGSRKMQVEPTNPGESGWHSKMWVWFVWSCTTHMVIDQIISTLSLP